MVNVHEAFRYRKIDKVVFSSVATYGDTSADTTDVTSRIFARMTGIGPFPGCARGWVRYRKSHTNRRCCAISSRMMSSTDVRLGPNSLA